MPTLLSLEALEADRLFVARQCNELNDKCDPWGTTRLMWKNRLKAIEEDISVLSRDRRSFASVALMFSGNPVIGTSDIHLDFATSALTSYKTMVALGMAAKLSDRLSDRGRVPGAERSKLYIRDMPRGSVGFLLEELPPEQTELLPSPLKETVEETTLMLDVLSAEPDEPCAERLREAPPRLVKAVREFAKVLTDSGAVTKILGDERKVELSAERIGRLYRRLNEVTVEETTETSDGILRGILPDFWQFDFALSPTGEVTKGAVAEELLEKWLTDADFRETVLLKPGTASFRRYRTLRGTKSLKEQVVLEDVKPRP